MTLALCGCAGAPDIGVRAQRLAEGVYMVPGAAGAATASNLGRIGNAGFIVGADGVLLIDTGTSHAHAGALLADVARVTDQPVRLALVTHTRPEFLFGGSALRERGIAVQMHERAAALMAARCETCLKNLVREVGGEEMAGTTMYRPDATFAGNHRVAGIGRAVQVLYFGHASGPGDIAVLDEESGVLFAGGLLDHRRVPDIQDSQLPAWHRALDDLAGLPLRTVVPGHGAAAGRELLADNARYLRRLEARVRELVEQGVSLLDAADAAELPEYSGWDEYDTIHRRNVSVAYLRIERELLFK